MWNWAVIQVESVVALHLPALQIQMLMRHHQMAPNGKYAKARALDGVNANGRNVMEDKYSIPI